MDNEQIWWILDGFIGRVSPTDFMHRLLALARQYEASIIAVESILFQRLLIDNLENLRNEQEGLEHLQIYPITYPRKMTKAERIQALAPRFERGAIRLPRHLERHDAIAELTHEIQQFTFDMRMLQYDDALDALAMAQFIPPATAVGFIPAGSGEKWTIEQMLLAGMKYHPQTGLPLSEYIDPDKLDPSLLRELRSRYYDRLEALQRQRKDRKLENKINRLGSCITRKNFDIIKATQ
ncbi:MAG: hypothetical protein DRJ64_07575 [Thermoprotei archaeon]|nr:MAG: hypothetical protein DRJ64_07575 [Thermoprotei archaeon]